MKISIAVLLVCLICLSGSCAKYYYQEDRTFDECSKDRIDCLSELKKRVASSSKKLGSYEYKYIEDCMKNKGYRLVTENQLPLDVKRLDPDTSLMGQLYGYRRGIAGTISDK